MLAAADRAIALRILASELTVLRDYGWRVENDAVRSDGSAAVTVDTTCTGPLPPGSVHLEFGFAFDRARPETVVWDCATGGGRTREDAIRQAVEFWLATTAPALIGSHDRASGLGISLPATGSLGVRGWDCFSGGHTLHGDAAGVAVMEKYLPGAPPLPAIADALPRVYPREALNGVKLLYSAAHRRAFAEVRINGVPDARASQALGALPWPPIDGRVTLRFFALLLRRAPGPRRP